MDRNSLTRATKDSAGIYAMSLALNRSVSEFHPLIMSFILSFDEIIHNMQIFFKLSVLVKNEPAEELNNKDLFLYCRENGVMRGSLGEWMFYQSLRKKIKPGMGEDVLNQVIKIAPKFVGEINFLIDGLERELRKYRTLN